jgi:hypothetical protein
MNEAEFVARAQVGRGFSGIQPKTRTAPSEMRSISLIGLAAIIYTLCSVHAFARDQHDTKVAKE